MKTLNIEEAHAHFAQVIEAVAAGEDVAIEKDGVALVRLTRMEADDFDQPPGMLSAGTVGHGAQMGR